MNENIRGILIEHENAEERTDRGVEVEGVPMLWRLAEELKMPV
jgi:hypothetical protein